MLCLPASVLMASINSRALFESPPGAGAFIVTVAMTFLLESGALATLLRCGLRISASYPSIPGLCARYSGSPGRLQRPGAMRAPPKRHSGTGANLIGIDEEPVHQPVAMKSGMAFVTSAGRAVL